MPPDTVSDRAPATARGLPSTTSRTPPSPAVVDPAGLAAALEGNAGAVRVLDVRSADEFAAGHVPGARHLDPAAFNRAEPPFGGLLPAPATVGALCRGAGLARGTRIVVADAGGATAAARAVWVLHAYGLRGAGWLDGGLRAWQGAGLPLERAGARVADGSDGIARDVAHAGDTPRLVGDNLVTADALLAELGDPALRVLDVRGVAEYAGTDVRAAEGGHVPGAVHLEWTRQLDAAGRALPADRLLADLAALDVRPEHRVVVYCQTHQRSAVTWVLMRHAGFPDVRGLDGAWSVWGNRPELPRERGQAPPRARAPSA